MLGPVRVREGGRAIDLGTRRQHALVAALALAGGRHVGTDPAARATRRRSPSGLAWALRGTALELSAVALTCQSFDPRCGRGIVSGGV